MAALSESSASTSCKPVESSEASMSDSESVQSSDLGISSSLSSEIPSLLDTLKCPAPSILARKRKVHFNPQKGKSEGKVL